MLSSMNFLVFRFTFWSIIHFELIFMKGIKSLSQLLLFFCMWMFSCFITVYKKSVFAPLYCLLSFLLYQRSRACFLGLHYVLLLYLSILPPGQHCVDYCSFTVILEVSICPLTLFFFSIEFFFFNILHLFLFI